MTALTDHKADEDKKVERVRVAAEMLGISERTVYRRLRSGRLSALPAPVHTTDNDMTDVSKSEPIDKYAVQMQGMQDLLMSLTVMTNDMILPLQLAVKTRDEQISALLDDQRKLRESLENLQGQVYELARLALSQTVPATMVAVGDDEKTPDKMPQEGKSVWRWLRGNRDDK